MLSLRHDIISWLSRNGHSWKLYSGMSPDESKCIEAGHDVESFETLLRALSPGFYSVKANKAGENNAVNWAKGYNFTKFEISNQETQPANNSPVASIGIGAIEVTNLVQKGIAEYKREEELALLRVRTKELEKELESNSTQVGIMKLANALIPHAPMLGPWIESVISGFMPQATAAVAGIPKSHLKVHYNMNTENNTSEEEEEVDPEMQARLVRALEILQENDPSIVENIELLAACVTQKPELYTMGIKMLRGQLS